MIKLNIAHGLLFCTIMVIKGEKSIILKNALIDTGSGGTILKADLVEEIGIVMEPGDSIEIIRGVGGNEFVYVKEIDEMIIGHMRVKDFKVEVGAMEYGFEIDAIIGLDLLMALGVVIDLKELVMRE